MKDINIKKVEKLVTPKMEKKYESKFYSQAKYLGNGVYNIPGTNLYSNDTRELFLMFCLSQEEIKIPELS